MAHCELVPVRRVTIARLSHSPERTLRAEGKSEKTVYSYLLSVRLLTEFLTGRGRDLTVDVSKDGSRTPSWSRPSGTHRRPLSSATRAAESGGQSFPP